MMTMTEKKLDPFQTYSKKSLMNKEVRYSHYTTPDKVKTSTIINVKRKPCSLPSGYAMFLHMKNGDMIQFDLHDIYVL